MFLVLLGVSVMGGGCFYLSWHLFSGELEASAASRLGEANKNTSSLILKLTRPLFHSIILPYAKRIEVPKWRKKWKTRIISAGLEEEIDVDELIAFKIFLGLVVPASIAIYLFLSTGSVTLWVLISLIIGGYVYPTAWVGGRRKKQHEAIRLQLPFVIDLLTLATEAGLDFIGALQKVVEKTKSGPLVNEMERMIQEIQLGTTRSESLRHLGIRIDLQEVSSFVAVLVTADQMGSSLGDVLRVQSELIRVQRFANAEKKGAAAAQKVLFPLIFFIMPAVFIMIFGPIVLSFFGVGK